jgi:soluble cytochrome b562
VAAPERAEPRAEPRAELRALHVHSQPQPSNGPRVTSLTPTPERRQRGVLSNSTHASVTSTSVHHMLTELVDLSHSIAALLEQEGLPYMPALTSSARQQEAGLKTQEIERIVRRVEAHFVDKIQTLEATNATLKDEVHQLREALSDAQARSENGKVIATAVPSHDVRGGLKEEMEALDALDKAWARDGNGMTALSEAEQLRQVLLAEKRQRLRVEEQTQSLTEQHAKVVGTLERRLKKQEEQLYDLIAAIDRGYTGTPASPTRSTERGPSSSSHRLPTPRHLLRQQLAQHQQTQRALQEYKENLRYESPSPTPSEDVTAMEELGLDDVRRTLESIRFSKPITVNEQQQPPPQKKPDAVGSAVAPTPFPSQYDERETVCTSVRATTATAAAEAPSTPPPPAHPSHRAAPSSTPEVDEITSFLDNITKELESLGAA